MRLEIRAILASTALFAIAACGKKADHTPVGPVNGTAAVSAPAGTDWTETVRETEFGGFVMGNPAAPVKLIEYASLTCPHCRDFAREATTPLRENYVKTGKVSWEFRSFPLNPIDVAATLLATCQGPVPFFKLVEQNYAEQEKWVLPYQQLTDAKQKELALLPQDQQFLGLARAGGLDNFYRVRGLPTAKAEACLVDKGKIDKIVAMRQNGMEKDKVEGTPTFIINGAKVDQPPTWPALEPELKKAGG
jgi:protein-disulfide isomerase